MREKAFLHHVKLFCLLILLLFIPVTVLSQKKKKKDAENELVKKRFY